MDENKIAQLQEIIDSSNNIVFFGGAGVSTESGIPDFRSQDGLYHLKYKYPPLDLLKNYDTASLTENESVSLLIKRNGCTGEVIALCKSLHI